MAATEPPRSVVEHEVHDKSKNNKKAVNLTNNSVSKALAAELCGVVGG